MHKYLIAVFSAALAVATPALAQVLTFEGVGNKNPVGNYYDGGDGGNLGISFSANALGIVDADAGGTGNFANETSPDTVLFFLSGSAATLNYAGGFDTGFSFFYTSSEDAFVKVWSGADSTGSLLATLNLTATPVGSGDPSGDPFNTFVPVGVSFLGIAQSIDFGGAADRCAFDNVTFGSAVPDDGTGGAVPEPSTYGLFGAAALMGVVALRRRMRRN